MMNRVDMRHYAAIAEITHDDTVLEWLEDLLLQRDKNDNPIDHFDTFGNTRGGLVYPDLNKLGSPTGNTSFMIRWIKEFRTLNDSGLKESKDAFDSYEWVGFMMLNSTMPFRLKRAILRDIMSYASFNDI